jgi:protease-4
VPAGLALPAFGAAVVEEPLALGTNPAGIGFVKDFALQYFHEGGARSGDDGDGLYLAEGLGPLGIGYGVEWLRPGEGGGPRYRRQRFALTLGDGRSAEVGFAWSWIGSRDEALDEVSSWDVGFTLRPLRFLSFGAAALGNGARLGGEPLPARFDLGIATRVWHDGLTLSADLLADDRGQAFRPTYVQLSAAAETTLGLALGLQLQVPLQGGTGIESGVSGLLSFTWNLPHAGWTGGGTQAGGDTGWFAGVRLSRERYRATAMGDRVPTVDVDDELRRRRVLVFTVGDRDPYGALVQRLATARDDQEVGAILVRIDGGLPLGAGRTEELRALLADARQKKPVLAYLSGGGTKEYWLASAATAIAAPPGAPLFVNGISTSQLYVRDLLARLGVVVQVVKAGAYKTATEPLVRGGPSPEAREAIDAVLDDVFGRLVADVAAARRLAPERVRALVDEGLFTTETARAAGLIDETLWPDELEGWVRQVGGRGLDLAGRYRPEGERRAQRWGRPPVIQVIRLEGIITREPATSPLGGDELAGARGVAAALRRAAGDRQVKAIVLRIESPGGDGLASDLIWREVVRARQKGKVVVASLGDLAASGGYLAAVGADRIVAQPSTLTGSIGVFAAKPDLSALLEKISVNREAFARGDKAQFFSLGRPWSDGERAALQKQIDAFYSLFVERVAEGRRLPRSAVEEVGAGRVWTGRQALEHRLVDRLGTLADAVALARELAALDPRDAVEVRREGGGEGILARMAQGVLGEAGSEGPLARLARELPELSALLLLADTGPVLALPEVWLEPVEP